MPKMVLELANAIDVALLRNQVVKAAKALSKLTHEDTIDYSLANPDTLTK